MTTNRIGLLLNVNPANKNRSPKNRVATYLSERSQSFAGFIFVPVHDLPGRPSDFGDLPAVYCWAYEQARNSVQALR